MNKFMKTKSQKKSSILALTFEGSMMTAMELRRRDERCEVVGRFREPLSQDILTGNPHASVDKYNQLKYSPETWERWINSSIIQFNRFKAPDYHEMLEKAGFKIIHFEVEPATAEDYAELGRIQIARCFERYTREELAARGLFFVAQKQ